MSRRNDGLSAIDEALDDGQAVEPGGKNALPSWPAPMNEAAFHGILGEIARKIEPETEADIAAILVQTLVAFGNMVGRGPHYVVEGDKHHANLFTVMVGGTSKGRKGTSWGRVRSVLEQVDEPWSRKRIVSGMSSGEGLVVQVCDRVEREKSGKGGKVETEVIMEGVTDKRLLVQEGEFASVLQVMARSGNTLSAVVRDAWDRGNLRFLTKNSPVQATGAHVSIIAHITEDELRRYLDRTETGNGFANRFLFVCVKRSKCLPDGGQPIDWGESIGRLYAVAGRAAAIGRLTHTQAARVLWHDVYPTLSEGKPGLMGAVTARAEAQTLRLAMLYALADGCHEIDEPHLRAALAVWTYCEASALYVFGEQLGDPVADEIMRGLRAASNGMTRTDISQLFNRHANTNQIGRALTILANQGLARSVKEETGGRPTERWFAA